MSVDEAKSRMRFLLGCCLPNPGFGPEDIVEVLYGREGKPYWMSGVIVAKLSSGLVGVITDSEDSTGHG